MNDTKITLTLTLDQLQMIDTLLCDKVAELQIRARPWNPPVGAVAERELRNMEYLLERVAEAFPDEAVELAAAWP